jgi:hypothetical protein
MKTLRNILILAIIVITGSASVNAQTSRKEKQAAKEAAVKAMVEAKQYTFTADYVLPQRGGGRQLNSDYDLRVKSDSVIAYLPYFGQAYFDVPYNPTDGGIKFTSTKFDYKVNVKKKGGWEITIKPADVKNTSNLFLYISADGYATLTVNSVNRDVITFHGQLEQKVVKK